MDSNEDGTYTVQFVPDRAGSFKITITVEDWTLVEWVLTVS